MFLGIDVSTQSLSGVVVDMRRERVVERISLNYDSCLPHYRTSGGLIPHSDPAVRHSDPVMWVEALGDLLARVGASRWAGRLRCIGVAAQQRGTVYLGADRTWDLTASTEQWRRGLTRPIAPTWMDDTAHVECAEIEDACGGPDSVSAVVGSGLMPRSSAPQIRRYYKQDPDGYARTALILLPSAYITSFLIGSDAPTEWGDAASTGLLDINRRDWAHAWLEHTAPDLSTRMSTLVRPASVVGTLPASTARAFGLPADVVVVAGTGDNLGSAVALGTIGEGRFAVSLGTSHTMFGETTPDRRDPARSGSVLPTREGLLGITVLRNGGLVLDALLRRLGLAPADLDDLMVDEPGREGRLVLPFVLPEIAPRIGPVGFRLLGPPEPWTRAQLVRGLLEAHAIRLRLHSAWIGEPVHMMVTGGSSRSSAYAQTVADVFGIPVTRLHVSDSAALGAAINAAAGWANESPASVAERFLVRQDALTVAPRMYAHARHLEQLEQYRLATTACVAAMEAGGPIPGMGYPVTV